MCTFLILDQPFSLSSVLSLGRACRESHGGKDCRKRVHHLLHAGPGLHHRRDRACSVVPVQTLHRGLPPDNSDLGMANRVGVYGEIAACI